MKKSALFALLLAFAAVSCKKSDSGSSGYHMTATIAGQAKNFNQTPPIATNQISGAEGVLTITGILNASTGETFMIMLTNTDGKLFTAGTYTDDMDQVDMQAVYTVGVAKQYYAGSAMASEAITEQVTIKNHLKIVISSIDTKTVKGTISGDMFDGGAVTGTPTPMVNGDFYAQIHQ
jgi:hypothetical protein